LFSVLKASEVSSHINREEQKENLRKILNLPENQVLKCWPFMEVHDAAMDKKIEVSRQKISVCGTYNCTCGCGSHSSTKIRQIVVIKHYKSMFFKETFSDHNTLDQQ